MDFIYLDHAASTPMEPESITIFSESLSEDYSNSSAAHCLGRKQSEKIEKVRELLYQKLEASPQDYEIVFTSSATESNNWIIGQIPFLKKKKDPDLSVIASSQSYHPSVVKPVARVLDSNEFESFELPLKQARVDKEALLSQIPQNTALLNFLWVNNSSGIITDVNTLAKELKQRVPSVWIHVDGVQGFAKFPISLKNSAIDSLTINAHKMGGPKGVGALIFRKDSLLPANLVGGKHEKGFRASSLNTSAILSWGAAVSVVCERMSEREQKVSTLCQFFQKELKEVCPEVEFPFSFQGEGVNSPYILSVVFPGVPSDILLRHLERRGVLVSTSSACSSRGSQKISPVYAAMGLPQEKHSQVLRISLSHQLDFNSLKEATKAISQEFSSLKRLFKAGR